MIMLKMIILVLIIVLYSVFFKPVTIKVYDYDWGASDDFIGQTMIDLSQLDLNTLTELRLVQQQQTEQQQQQQERRQQQRR